MENSYKFFRNIDCQFFPCHQIEDKKEFNCLFCYCPLFLIEDCGGNYHLKGRIKDCSKCTVPHKPSGYAYVNQVLKDKIFTKDP